MSQSVSDQNNHPVLKSLVGTGLLIAGLAAGLMAVLSLPWLVLRAVLWISR